ncbi:O-antigen ligase family protein [Paenarthrobacter sp. NPDC057981]|uniref:O-antigen ligase family protein n=1 Tax=Paenarthrobacter sp. NPDC057981 TaxID=3346297 RepID=UPI0036DDD0E1
MRDYIEYAIAITAAIALLFNLKALRRSAAVHRDLTGWLALVVVVLGGLLYEARVIPGGPPVLFVILGIMMALLLLTLLKSRRSTVSFSRKFSALALFPALIGSCLFVVNAVMNVSLPFEQSFGRLLAVAILVMSALISSFGRMNLKDFGRVMMCSLLIILIISPTLGQNWRSCDIFKCGPFEAIYTGPFPSENALAIFACVAILFALFVNTRLNLVLSLIPFSVVLYATESRTSQTALFISLGAWAGSILWRKLAKSLPRRRHGRQETTLFAQATFFSVVVVGVFGLGFILLMTANPSSFSNRGNVWIRGLYALGSDWPSGLGLDRWTYLQTIGILPPLFPHSQYLLLLFGGGVVAVGLMLVLFSGGLIAAARRSAKVLSFTVAYIVFLLVLGLTEAYWNPIAFDGHTLLVIPLVILAISDPSVPADAEAATGLTAGAGMASPRPSE